MKRKKTSMFKQAAKEAESTDAVMMPVMSLMIILIPFLVGNLAFYHFKSVDVALPGTSEEAGSQDKNNAKMKVVAYVKLRTQDLRLELLDENSGRIVEEVKFSGDDKGMKKARSHLLTLKKKYRKLDLLLVSAAKQLKYKHLVDLLEQCRNPGAAKGASPAFNIVLLPGEEV